MLTPHQKQMQDSLAKFKIQRVLQGRHVNEFEIQDFLSIVDEFVTLRELLHDSAMQIWAEFQYVMYNKPTEALVSKALRVACEDDHAYQESLAWSASA